MIRLIVFLILLVSCGACYYAHVTDPGARPPHEQAMDAVLVRVTCEGLPDDEGMVGVRGQGGSGVMVSDRHVLTAAHVVNCDDAAIAAAIHVTTVDGRTVRVRLDVFDPDHDIARLEIVGSERFSATTPRVGPTPGEGDTVCLATAWPERGFNCGEVKSVDKSGVFWHTALTLAGNSGGGVYDEFGDLVGLVSRRYMDNSGGMVVPILPELMPKQLVD